MTTIYAVFKTAVYRHECGGVFSSLELAEQAARSLMAGEPDDHHWYEVTPFVLDTVGAQETTKSGRSGGGKIDECDRLCAYYRRGGMIVRTEEPWGEPT